MRSSQNVLFRRVLILVVVECSVAGHQKFRFAKACAAVCRC
jgi:hypothetical protein